MIKLALLPLFGVLVLSACSSSPSPESAAQRPTVALDLERIRASWPIHFATEDSFGAYGSQGWVMLAQKRNYRRAMGLLEGPARARAHVEAAGMFRQAALVSAHAAIETYAKTPQATDPVGAAHLLTVAYILDGDLEKARASSARLDAIEDVTKDWHAPWKKWLSEGAAWPPNLSALPVELPSPTLGLWPVLSEAENYKLPVQTDGSHAIPMGDPGALVRLAMWHEAAAVLEGGADPGVVNAYLARYRFPIEKPGNTKPLTMDFLYASDFLAEDDGAFMADLHGKDGVAAIEAHAPTSLIAQFALDSRVDGKIDAEKAIDLVNALRKTLVTEAKALTGQEVKLHHRLFADIAAVGMLRNLSLVAEVEGDREQSGKLRIQAMEASHEHTGCAVALLSLAAWDAQNRYPTRAQEIIHRNSKFYPSLEIARFGLDVLALRVSRERVETPGM